jgi:hypothetical protein
MLCIIMKKIHILIISLFYIGVSAQNISEINSDLKLSDSLTYETEIRIYHGGGITNHSSLFRMFKDKSEIWSAEFYEHYAKVDGQAELRTEKRILNSKNEMQFVFLNLIRSYILDLPDQKDIYWKLNKRGDVEKVEKNRNGKINAEYDLLSQTVRIVDGSIFRVYVRAFNRSNEFVYSNPKVFLSHYPEINELIYMSEILNTIQNEFGVWKK